MCPHLCVSPNGLCLIETHVGDVVLFLKSDKEFDKQYQYGIVKDKTIDKDGKIRKLTV